MTEGKRQLDELLDRAGVMDRKQRFDSRLVVSEALTNASRYGQSPVWFRFEVSPGNFHATFSYASDWFDTYPPAPVPQAQGGRGILIMRAYAEMVDYHFLPDHRVVLDMRLTL